MKQKTRYNIRLAQKKEIEIIKTDQVEFFYQLMTNTGSRDGFEVHSLSYYQRAYDLFAKSGQCALLLATFQGRVLAGLMVFRQGSRAWYLYGASSDEERNRMPAYLLQWEAMRWAARNGCIGYDLWGIPDEDEATLEAEFMNRTDGLWQRISVQTRFWRSVLRAAPSWDRVYQPLVYRAYQLWSRFRSRRGQLMKANYCLQCGHVMSTHLIDQVLRQHCEQCGHVVPAWASTDWQAGDDSTHQYLVEGHYTALVQVRDDAGSISTRSVNVSVVNPVTGQQGVSSAPQALGGNRQLWVVNPDNDTVTRFDSDNRFRIDEIRTCADPRSVAIDAQQRAWITCHDADQVLVLDADGRRVGVIDLGYGAAPFAVAYNAATTACSYRFTAAAKSL